MSQHNLPAYIKPAWFVGLVISVLFAFHAMVFAADENNSGDIVVTDVRGDVNVVSRGNALKMHVGSVIALPATIRTGTDGQLDLRQGQTTVAISANSVLDIPTTSLPGGTIDRIMQPRGSAFYKVGKRETHKLRVETPYLVAVVKGTQFNVVAQTDSATIALFEGLLEVRATDNTDVVDLNAGEIAVRYGNASSIRVLRMDTGETIRAQVTPQNPGLTGANSGLDGNANQVLLGNTDGAVNGAANTITIGGSLASVSTSSNVTVGTGTTVNSNLGAGSVSISNTTGAALGSVSANLGVDASASLGGANLGSTALGVATSTDLSNGSLSTSTTANLGVTNVGANISAGSSGITTNVSLGNVDLGLSVGLAGSSSMATTATSATVAAPVVSTPVVTVPAITTPLVTTPAITTPAITTPVVTTPVVTVPAITDPVVTTPAITTPSVDGLVGSIGSALGLP